LQHYPAHQVTVEVKRLLRDPEGEISRAVFEFSRSEREIFLLQTDTLEKGPDSESAEGRTACAQAVDRVISSITAKVLQNNLQIGALVCSGGDTTVSVCRALGVSGMEVLDEIKPLIACGEILGGRLKIVTKGGMAGEPDAYLSCISYLRKE